ncbi:MAG TPA: chemotaxis protein CheW [Gammaproteobacteria bacterium]|nr:chemotaxis protein CheW [Gammaproteobacteria bacterium]
MADNNAKSRSLGPRPVAALSRFPGLAPEELPVAPVEHKPETERWAVPLGPYRLLVEPEVGCELSEWAPVWPVPNTPRWISGVMNLRGTLVPVFDLRPLFKAQANWSARNKKLLFVVGAGESAGAVIAEGLPYRQRLNDAEAPDAVPEDLPEPLALRVSAAYRQKDVLWLDCDLPGLLQDLGTRVENNIAGVEEHETPT